MKVRQLVLLVTLITSVVGCDHATKYLAKDRLDGQPAISLIAGVLDLRYTENRDVGFSLLRWVPPRIRAPLVIVLPLLTTPILLIFWARNRRALLRSEHAGFAMIIAGGLGNLVDRLVRGYVIDFIHLRHWPVFNVADMAVVAGAALLLFSIFQRRRERPGHTA
jgi:signal peptidase II